MAKWWEGVGGGGGGTHGMHSLLACAETEPASSLNFTDYRVFLSFHSLSKWRFIPVQVECVLRAVQYTLHKMKKTSAHFPVPAWVVWLLNLGFVWLTLPSFKNKILLHKTIVFASHLHHKVYMYVLMWRYRRPSNLCDFFFTRSSIFWLKNRVPFFVLTRHEWRKCINLHWTACWKNLHQIRMGILLNFCRKSINLFSS